MIITCLSVAGALEISYVQSIIISKGRSIQFRKKTLFDIYWHDLSKKDRWLFWTGFVLLISPFTLAILI